MQSIETEGAAKRLNPAVVILAVSLRLTAPPLSGLSHMTEVLLA